MRLALVLVWLSCFAGTFPLAYTNPSTNVDGSLLTDLHHTEWWLHRCLGDSVRLADRPATGKEGRPDSFDVGDLNPNVYWLKGVAVDNSGNKVPWRNAPNLTFAITDTIALPPPPPPPDTSGTGILGKYYSGQSRNQWIADRRDTTIDFAWGLGSPMAGVPEDYWSAEWVGKLVIATAGVYTFYLASQDGGRLYINNGLYIDKWVTQPLTEWTAMVNLAAGEHNIVVEYTARVGNSECHLMWGGPGISKRIVPKGVLR